MHKRNLNGVPGKDYNTWTLNLTLHPNPNSLLLNILQLLTIFTLPTYILTMAKKSEMGTTKQMLKYYQQIYYWADVHMTKCEYYILTQEWLRSHDMASCPWHTGTETRRHLADVVEGEQTSADRQPRRRLVDHQRCAATVYIQSIYQSINQSTEFI